MTSSASVIVCGGRDYGAPDQHAINRKADEARVIRQLETLDRALAVLIAEGDKIVTGGGTGADFNAKVWAAKNGHEYVDYPANWAKFGRPAGPMRNSAMLKKEKPRLVIGFPGGRGTQDMLGKAQAARILVAKIGADGRLTMLSPESLHAV